MISDFWNLDFQKLWPEQRVRFAALLFLGIVVFGSMGNANSSIANRPETADACTPHDTTTADGTRITYIRQKKGGYRIGWSGKGFERESDSLYDCSVDEEGIWDFIPKVCGESRRYVLLKKMLYTSSAASTVPLEYSFLLFPKDRKSKVLQLDYFVERYGDHVLYADEDAETLHLIDLNSDVVKDVKMIPSPVLSRSPTIPIRKTAVKSGVLVITYGADGKNGKVIDREIKFKLGNPK